MQKLFRGLRIYHIYTHKGESMKVEHLYLVSSEKARRMVSFVSSPLPFFISFVSLPFSLLSSVFLFRSLHLSVLRTTL